MNLGIPKSPSPSSIVIPQSVSPRLPTKPRPDIKFIPLDPEPDYITSEPSPKANKRRPSLEHFNIAKKPTSPDFHNPHHNSITALIRKENRVHPIETADDEVNVGTSNTIINYAPEDSIPPQPPQKLPPLQLSTHKEDGEKETGGGGRSGREEGGNGGTRFPTVPPSGSQGSVPDLYDARAKVANSIFLSKKNTNVEAELLQSMPLFVLRCINVSLTLSSSSAIE